MTDLRDPRIGLRIRTAADLEIPTGSYLDLKAARLPGRPVVTRSVAALARPQLVARSKSSVTAVGGQPAGFGTTVTWVGNEDLAVIGFVAASDEYGIGISGVTDGDTIQFSNAVGTATFDQDSTNGWVSSLVTIVAAGAGLTAAAFGRPDLVPLIDAAAEAIKQQFPERKHPSKPRDPYGQISGSNDFARQEGGLLICSPRVQGVWQSGDGDHTNRWISSSHDRDDAHRPAHVRHAFFLQRNLRPRMLDGNGELIICPWDHSFADNIGFYRVSFILRRGNRPPERID